MVASEKLTRGSGRRRRRYNRRSGKRDKNTASAFPEQAVEEQNEQLSRDEQGLPEVFIYTYTIYKGTGG